MRTTRDRERRVSERDGRITTVRPNYTHAELEREYSPSHLVADLGHELTRYAEASARARDTLDWRELRYGADRCERIDFFPAATPDAPLVVFIHGGYWQELGKADASFPALDFVDRGIAYAAIGYGLAPTYRMDQIVAMARRAVRWLNGQAESLGCQPGLYLSGSSAGAHLAAMCLVPGWLPAHQSVAGLVRGAVLLSGVYDLEPLLPTYVNDALGLTAADAASNSPSRYLPATLPPTVVALGERETAEFTRQQREFEALARAGGTDITGLVVTGRHHYDICFDLADPTTAVGGALTTLIDRTRSQVPTPDFPLIPDSR